MRRRDRKTGGTLAISLLLLAAPLAAWAAGGVDLDRLPAGACRSDQPAVFQAAKLPGCATNDQCGADEFCARLVGECGNPGQCETRPKECGEHGHMFIKPMCGCDGKNYDNACLAAVAGTSVDHEGSCAAP